MLGLYLHIAYHKVMSTFSRKVGHGQVTPAIIGVITMLAEHPGISQARLARDRPGTCHDRQHGRACD